MRSGAPALAGRPLGRLAEVARIVDVRHLLHEAHDACPAPSRLDVHEALALQGPRSSLLTEIGGTAAYRALRSLAGQDLVMPGAVGPAAERLRRETAPLRKIATWPGMSVERANRMLNALYLSSNLIVSRTHHTARPGMWEWLLGRGRH